MRDESPFGSSYRRRQFVGNGAGSSNVEPSRMTVLLCIQEEHKICCTTALRTCQGNGSYPTGYNAARPFSSVRPTGWCPARLLVHSSIDRMAGRILACFFATIHCVSACRPLPRVFARIAEQRRE